MSGGSSNSSKDDAAAIDRALALHNQLLMQNFLLRRVSALEGNVCPSCAASALQRAFG
jgi:hypothetical protein